MAGSMSAVGLGAVADRENQISTPMPTIVATARIGTSRDGPAGVGGTTSGGSMVTSSIRNAGGDTRAARAISTVVVTMSGR